MGFLSLAVKYLLLGVAFVTTLISFFIIGIGAILLYFEDDIFKQLPTELLFIPAVIVAVGGVLFLIASFGCCGVIAETRCLLISFLVPILIMMAGNIYLSTLLSGDNVKTASTVLEQELDSRFENSQTRSVFYVLEGLFKCCGTTGPESYEDLNVSLPPTCCPDLSFNNVKLNNSTNITSIEDLKELNLFDSIEFCARDVVNTNGCTPIIVGLFTSLTNGIYYFIVALITVQAIGILSSSCLTVQLGRKLKNKEKKHVDEIFLPQPAANPAFRSGYDQVNYVSPREQNRIGYRGPNRNSQFLY